MDILLAAVNAKYIHTNLAVYSLRAYCREFSRRISLREYTINQGKDQILKDIYHRAPRVLCFSCYIWNISYVKELIRDIHKILPDTIIWTGGPEVSYDPENFLQEMPEVFGVMLGEGEETFRKLVEYYVNSKEEEGLYKIPGICFRGKEGTVNSGFPDVLDMDRLVFPYEDLSSFSHKILYYESSRGCPFSCSYCLSSVDKKLRFKSLDLVKKELDIFLEAKVPQVKFVDRTFNCREDHALEIWRYIQDHDNGVTNFHFEIGADLLTEKEIALIRTMRPGLIQLEIGVQSTNEKTLKEIRRYASFEKIAARVRAVYEGGNIHQHLDLIAGLPWEDYSSFSRSFNQVYALAPQQLQLGFLKVLKGSYMYEKAGDYGCIYKEKEPYEVLKTRWLSYGDIIRLKSVEEMVEIYYNSGQFSNTIKQMEGFFPRPARMFQELGEWHEQMGLRDMGHSRLARYENLFRFLAERFPDEGDLFRDALTVDYYLRENAGTRPSFARDQKEYREGIRSFYQEEGKARRYLNCGYEGFDSRQMAKMTHLEVLGDGRVLLFDYRNRDALTKNAAVWEIAFAAGGVQDGEFICGSGSGDHRLKSEDGSDPGNRRSADRRREGGGRISDAGESGISS